MKFQIMLAAAITLVLSGFSHSNEATPTTSPPATGATASMPAAKSSTQETTFTDAEVEEYIRLFPYQDTFNYAMRYTQGEPSRLNEWVLGGEPSLVKAGEDKVVRMNNDTFYKMAFVYLNDQPVYLQAETPNESRFVSFQLMDDHNVNYHNIIFPNGEFTLYHGEKPKDIRGEAIAVPSALSVVIVRVEVKDPGDAEDVSMATDVFRTITIEGPEPESFPEGDVLSAFPEAVAKEAHYRMDKVFEKIPFRLTVVGPGKNLGDSTPYLYHSAGTRGGWGGPGTEHSSYETISSGRDQKPLKGANGTYTVNTEAPAVDAFWSLTVYDSERGGFLHPNKYDRYHINNTMAATNTDGTYTFQFKQDCSEDDINCLEVPAGRFDVAARYYLPSKEIQSGEWVLPPFELR